MNFILEGAGVFIYPLGLCSLVAAFIVFERVFALRASKVVPRPLEEAVIMGKIPEISDGLEESSLGRMVYFCRTASPDSDAVKAFAQFEITRLERGMFLLDGLVSAAPLLGLLGTVSGLVSVFSGADMPTQESISRGVGLALSTTILGLAIAIPGILASSFLYRRIDTLGAALNVCAERLAAAKK